MWKAAIHMVFYKDAILKISKIHRKQTDKMGYSRKDPNRGAEDILLWKLPGTFHFFTLPLEIPDKTKLNPCIFHKIVRFLTNFKAKKKDPWKFHIIFSWSPLEIPLYF